MLEDSSLRRRRLGRIKKELFLGVADKMASKQAKRKRKLIKKQTRKNWTKRQIDGNTS
jgi:hypothetical protein